MFLVSDPDGSYCVSSDFALAASNLASGSLFAPWLPIRPVVIRPPVAAEQITLWHTVVARPCLSTASAKAMRRPLAVAVSPWKGPPVGYPTLKLTQVVRPLGWVSRSGFSRELVWIARMFASGM